MLDFVHAKSKRLKIIKNTRYRFSSHQYGWRKQESRLIILIKQIYAIIFICFTILSCLNPSIDNKNECLKSISIQIWDIWYSFLGLILILSLFIDRLKRQNIISLKIFNCLQILLIISFIIFVILGHIQSYNYVWWTTLQSIEFMRLTFLSIILIDICPISVAIIIIIDSLRKHRSCRRIHTNTIISNV